MNSRKLACFLLALLAAGDVHCSFSGASTRARTFEIDYERDIFLMDGEPFQYVAGSMHYFRSPHQNWREKLRAIRAAGLNTVTTYVEWSFHEPEYRQFEWTGDKDIVSFIEMAQEEDLYVILRPGPYICAERDLGGFPYWLLSRNQSIKLRTNDAEYKTEVTEWYTQLMPKIRPLLYGNGGPIIMVQVENEYGVYSACDKDYMAWLAQLISSWIMGDAVLFTTDKPTTRALSCGSTPGVYATVDFGTAQNVTAAWEAMREFSPRGPLVNSEFYPGWLVKWGDDPGTVTPEKIVEVMEQFFASNASFNFYMFHGGTNFGFSGGAVWSPTYLPDITSYDYDAPLTEAGDPTPKYLAIRNTIDKYMPLPDLPVPIVKRKGAYGVKVMNPILALLSSEGRARLSTKVTVSTNTQTMEALGQNAGLLLYESEIPRMRPDPSLLFIRVIRDRAMVYINGSLSGVMSRTRNVITMPVMAFLGNELQIIVENQGRINYEIMDDFKGIRGDVLLNTKPISNWTMTSFPLKTIEPAVANLTGQTLQDNKVQGPLRDGPIVYSQIFAINDTTPLDTYLDMSGWGKGIAWLNDVNLGRYWPDEGPQITLYVPGVYLNPSPLNNTLIIMELQHAPNDLSVRFVAVPNLG